MTLLVSNENKADILNDHYKDTCLRLERYRKQRNRLVFYAAIMMLIIFFFQIFPTETLRIVASIFLRIGLNKVPEIADDSGHVARPFLGIVLLTIAFTFKHYRIAMDKQFAYVKILESDLNSLYPKSNLFKRETNFSLKESNSFSMWDSTNYSKMLTAGCVFLIGLDALIIINFDSGYYLAKAFVAILGIFATLLSIVFFATKNPLTDANIRSLLTTRKEVGQHNTTTEEQHSKREPESRVWLLIAAAAITVFWGIALIELFCCTF